MTDPHSASGERAKGVKLTADQANFLCRFVSRGWLHATRDSIEEQFAVDKGLMLGYLRREFREAHFTPTGRAALSDGGSDA